MKPLFTQSIPKIEYDLLVRTKYSMVNFFNRTSSICLTNNNPIHIFIWVKYHIFLKMAINSLVHVSRYWRIVVFHIWIRSMPTDHRFGPYKLYFSANLNIIPWYAKHYIKIIEQNWMLIFNTKKEVERSHYVHQEVL